MLSEYYHLRRTAIKDIASYLGFLTGFIGAAPLAWGILSARLQSEDFVRGLWYFFAIVVATGIFTGIVGMGVGHVLAVLWAQLHRHRRRDQVAERAMAEARSADLQRMPVDNWRDELAGPPQLRLVSFQPEELPRIDGRRLASVKFRAALIDLDFSGIQVRTANPTVVCGGHRLRMSDAGARDALCSLIGTRVERVRAAGTDRIEIALDSGCELVIACDHVDAPDLLYTG
ncbi:MAG: hypothetical protein ABIS03_11810 [Gemmatimonadaceae bacterium]